jgi:hypothetical protein
MYSIPTETTRTHKLRNIRVIKVIAKSGDRSSILNFLRRLSAAYLDSGITSHVYTTLILDASRLCPRPTDLSRVSKNGHHNPRYPRADAPNSLRWPDEDATRFLAVIVELWATKRRGLAVALVAAMDLNLSLDQESGQNFWDHESVKVIRFITEFVLLLKNIDDKSLTNAGKGAVLSAIRDHAKWVGRKEPKKPNNWARTLHCHHCKCTECDNLNFFLQDPSVVSTQFTLSKKKRAHVEQALNRKWYILEKKTLGRGQDDTLVITKTNKEYERDLKSWEIKLNFYRSNLESLRGDFVEQMLGQDFYKQFVLLEMGPSNDLASAASAANKQPLPSSDTAETQAATVPSQVAGVKRKAQEIDLSGDD